MMLTRRADAPLDFDFAKVVEASKDNPVFYVQYAHARISSLKRKAADAGIDLPVEADLSLLDDEELALVKRAAQYPRVVESAAMAHEPHRIAFYLYDLAAEFHALWNRGNDDPARRFLVENNPQLSRARLELALGIGQIIRSGLRSDGGRRDRGDALTMTDSRVAVGFDRLPWLDDEPERVARRSSRGIAGWAVAGSC